MSEFNPPSRRADTWADMSIEQKVCTFWLWNREPLAQEDLLNCTDQAEAVKVLCDEYEKLAGMSTALRKNVKSITKTLQSVEETIDELIEEPIAEDDEVTFDLYLVLSYDFKLKLELFEREFKQAKSSETDLKKVQRILGPVHDRVIEAESHNLEQVSRASSRILEKLSSTKDQSSQGANSGDEQVPGCLEEMAKVFQTFHTEVHETKKLRYMLENIQPLYIKLMTFAKLTVDVMHEASSKREGLSASLAQYEKQFAQMQNTDVVHQVMVIWLKTLKMGATLILQDISMPAPVPVLCGDDWKEQTFVEINTRLRSLSLVFHPDKNTWAEDLLSEAGATRDIFGRVQTVINEARSYLKRVRETLDVADSLMKKADMEFKEALINEEAEQEANKSGEDETAKSYFNKKVKHAFKAIDSWRAALRMFTHEQLAVQKAKLIHVRMKLAEACFLVRLPLEGQVYLLAALKITCRVIGQTALGCDLLELEKYRDLWKQLRAMLETQLEKTPTTPEEPEKASSSQREQSAFCSGQCEANLGLVPAASTKIILQTSDLTTWDDIKSMIRCTRSFDPRGAMVLGPAIEHLTANRLQEMKLRSAQIYKEIAKKCTIASFNSVTQPNVYSAGASVAAASLLPHSTQFTVALVLAVVPCTSFCLGVAMTAGLFYVALRRQVRKKKEQTLMRLRQKVVTDILLEASDVLSSGGENAGERFIKILSQDLGELPEKYFAKGTKILHFPSPRFVFEGILIDNVKETIDFLTVDLEICPVGVLDILIKVAEVIASRQILNLDANVVIKRESSFAAAKIIMGDLLDASGGVNQDRKMGDAIQLKRNPKGSLLLQAIKEDKAKEEMKNLEQLIMSRVLILRPHGPSSTLEELKAFLSSKWPYGGVFVTDDVPSSLGAEGVFVDMEVVEAEVVMDDLSVETHGILWVEDIVQCLYGAQVQEVRLIVRKGLVQHVTEFWKMHFGIGSATPEIGEKQRELIKLREILKINIAILFLMESDDEASSVKSPGELISEWLLVEVIQQMKEIDLTSDERLWQRVEALKDFYLVFVGQPLPLAE